MHRINMCAHRIVRCLDEFRVTIVEMCSQPHRNLYRIVSQAIALCFFSIAARSLLLLDWIERMQQNGKIRRRSSGRQSERGDIRESNEYYDNNLRFYFIVQTRHDLCVRNDFKDFHSLAADDVFILLAIFRFFFSVFSPSGDACCTLIYTQSDSDRTRHTKIVIMRDRESDNMDFFPIVSFGIPRFGIIRHEHM